MYIYIYLFTHTHTHTHTHREDATQDQFFIKILTGLNSEFSFS